MIQRPHIMYYAFGGGLGHASRMLALSRQLARAIEAEHWLLINTPFRCTLTPELERQSFLQVDWFDADGTPTEARRFVDGRLKEIRPDVLIIDTFPRGLGGEFARLFPALRAQVTVLIGRHLPDQYVDSYDLRAFVQQHFDLVIAPNEVTPFDQQSVCLKTDAFLLRSRDELPSYSAACRSLNVDCQCVLLVGNGTRDECREFSLLFEHLQHCWPAEWPPLRFVQPDTMPTGHETRSLHHQFPLIDCLSAVRLLIGSAGFNLVHEARSLGIPAILKPRVRKYDDQFLRAKCVPQFDTADELLLRIEETLSNPRGHRIPAFSNGAEPAARLITDLVTPD